MAASLEMNRRFMTSHLTKSRCLEIDNDEINEIVPKEGKVYSVSNHLSPIPTPSLVAAHVKTSITKYLHFFSNTGLFF